jgi:glyoxylase-like metal-dependent hydrolase (beta-lactamase superfamily II)
VPCRYSVTYILVENGQAALVDAGSGGDVGRIAAALESVAPPRVRPRFILPTHLHFDHVIGLHALAARLGVPVMLGRVAAEHARGGRPVRYPGRARLARSLATWLMQGMPFPPLADWKEGWSFGLPWGRNLFSAPLEPAPGHRRALPGLEGWILLETPGHSDDSICLHHPRARFLVSGDTVRNFLGGEWNPLHCDAGAYARTRAMLRSLDVDTIFPAHGPVIEGADVIRRVRTPGLLSP